MFRPVVCLIGLGAVLTASWTFVPLATLAMETKPLSGLAQDGDDPPEILTPSRDEGQQDRLTSSAMFAHARLLYQRDDLPGALRRYQRAYRYDPTSEAALDAIVALAFELEHQEEAARYAVIQAEKNPKDSVLLRRLAMHLTEEQDYARALKLYQQSFKLQKDADDITAILLHMEVGRLNFLEGNFPAAAESFERVRDALADPKKYDLSEELQKIVLGNAQTTYSLLGESFLQAGKYDDAEAMFRKADQEQANPGRLAFLLARIRAKQKRTDDVLKELDAYFGEKAKSAGVEAYDLLAEALLAKADNEAAASAALLAKLQTLHAADGDNIALSFAYGRALRKADKLDEAVKVFSASLDKEVTTEMTEQLVGIYQQRGQVAELLTLLGKSVGKTGALSSIGDAGKALGQDQELVKKIIVAARDKKGTKPDDLPAGEALAAALLAMQIKDYDAVDEFYSMVIANPPAGRLKNPKTEAMLAWGLEHFQNDQYARAAKVFQQALDQKLTGDRTELFQYFLAGALEMQGQTDAALAAIDKAIASGKPSTRLLGRKAWILYHAKRYAEAEKEYLALIKKFDKDHKTAGVRDALREARLVLSNICTQTDRLPEGVEWLEQVLDEYPEDVGAHNDLGYLWAERGLHRERALRMTQFAVSQEPDNPAYRDSLGWAYFQLGRYAEAIAELEKAIAIEAPDGVILDHLADAYAKHMQRDKAIAMYEKAIAAFEKEPSEAGKLKAAREKLAVIMAQ